MKKEIFTKRTKILLVIFGIVALVAIILGVWYGNKLKSEAAEFATGQTPIAGKITGEVHDKNTGARISGASASAKASVTAGGVGRSSGTATSGSTGVFSITNMSSGSYTVKVTKSGYQSWQKSGVVCKFYQYYVVIAGRRITRKVDNCNLGRIDLTPTATETHKECSGTTCATVSGSGTNQCSSDADCQVTTGLTGTIYVDDHLGCVGSTANCKITLIIDGTAYNKENVNNSTVPLITLSSGSHVITGGTLVGSTGTNYGLAKVDNQTLPRSINITGIYGGVFTFH